MFHNQLLVRLAMPELIPIRTIRLVLVVRLDILVVLRLQFVVFALPGKLLPL